MEPKTTDTLVRAARELLRWDQKLLAEKAKVGLATVRRFETGAFVKPEIVEAITGALRKAGIAFLGPGAGEVDIREGVALTSAGRPLARPQKRVYRRRIPKPSPSGDGQVDDGAPT